MSTFKDIIDRFDTAESLAREIGEKGVTVRQWRNRGSIPSRYWPKIIAAADRRAVTGITLDAFMQAQATAATEHASH
jgi:hypothetical protein